MKAKEIRGLLMLFLMLIVPILTSCATIPEGAGGAAAAGAAAGAGGGAGTEARAAAEAGAVFWGTEEDYSVTETHLETESGGGDLVREEVIESVSKMPKEAMYLVPDPEEWPDEFVIFPSIISPREDIGAGWGNKIAWPSFAILPSGELLKTLAINVGELDGKRYWWSPILRSLKEVEGALFGVCDRCMTKIYNEFGEAQPLQKTLFGKINFTAHEDFLPEITRDNVMVIKKNTSEYDAFIPMWKRWMANEITWRLEYVYEKYGSVWTQKELELIAKEDTIVRDLLHWLGSDWSVILGAGWTPEHVGITALVAKVISVPNIWENNDRDGCLGYMPDAADAAEIAVRATEVYGSVAVAPPSLSEDQRNQLHLETGEWFETYDDFYRFSIGEWIENRRYDEGTKRHNLKIDEENQNGIN